MDLQEVARELENYIRKQFKVADNDPDFNADVHLFDYGYIDSFGAVSLIGYVEKTFALKVSESDLIAHPLNTIRDIAAFVVKRQKGEN